MTELKLNGKMVTINTKTDLSALTYEQKKQIADTYLQDKVGIGWDDLSDINSLHDCEDLDSIHEACDERLEEDGMPMDWFDYE
ncbi:MAG TPA: hypothetical protein PLI89_03665 [Chitinophagales bacterium]|nr:hypothetical protein [Chitinophagales bacterium]